MVSPTTKATLMKYRTRLKELRGNRFTRMDIVRGANMSYPTVVSWENDALSSINPDKAAAVMQLLGCTFNELIYIVDED